MRDHGMADDRPATDDLAEPADAGGVDATVVEFDPSGVSVPQVVTEGVVRRSGRDPLTLPPLQTVIDCDALDGLFGGRRGWDRSTPEGLTVTFEYVGYRVTVNQGRVVVQDQGQGQ